MTIKSIAKISRHKVANAGIQFCPVCNRVYPCNATQCACQGGTNLQPVIMTASVPEYYPAGN